MPEAAKRLRRSVLFVGAGVILMTAVDGVAQSKGAFQDSGVSQSLPEVSDPGPALILELTDTALISRAWETLFPDSSLPDGEYQILIPSGPSLSTGRSLSSTVFLLRNGTEAGHMERSTWETLASNSSRERQSLAEAMEGPERQDVPLLWNAVKWEPATLLAWAEWPAEFSAAMGAVVSLVRFAQPQYQRDIDFVWNQKLFSHFLLGTELHRTQFGGVLTRLDAMAADIGSKNPALVESPGYWSEADWWWGVSAGVPGLKYTLVLADQSLPRYYWLDPLIGEAIQNRKPGRLVKQWTGSSTDREGNLSHTLEARLGGLGYALHLDQDAYRAPVHTFSLVGLPAAFGTWGLGLVMASDILATRLWMDIPDAGFDFGLPKAYPSRFRIAFLHLDLAYRNLRSFNLGISVRVRVENPVMNLPGA